MISTLRELHLLENKEYVELVKQYEEATKILAEHSDEELIKRVSDINLEISNLQKELAKFSTKINFSKKEKLTEEVKQLTSEKISILQLQQKRRTLNTNIAGIKAKIDELKQDVLAIKSSRKMGYSLDQVVELFKKYNREFVLTENDMLEEYEGSLPNELSMNDFCFVHKTRYIPNNNHISTPLEAGATAETVVQDKVKLEIPLARNTVHTAINGEVSSHAYGQFDDCNYIIIIPYQDAPLDKLVNGAVMDSYFEGGIDLPPSTVILCPKDKMEEVKEKNPNVRVVPFLAKDANGFGDLMVNMMGYKVESIEMWSWGNDNDAKRFYNEFFTKNFPNKKIGPHMYTLEHTKEDSFTSLNALKAYIEGIMSGTIPVDALSLDEMISYVHFDIVAKSDNNTPEIESFNKNIITNLVVFLNQYGITVPDNLVHDYLRLCKSEPLDDEQFKEFKNANLNNNEYDYAKKIIITYIMQEIRKVKTEQLSESNNYTVSI